MHHPQSTIRYPLLAACCLLIFAVGCGRSGPTTVSVSGTVTLDGKPLSDASIMFVPSDPKLPPEGGNVVEGKFAMRAKPGKNRVEIRATRPPHGMKPDPTLPRGAGWEQYLPARYNAQSELTAEVSAKGNAPFDWKLESRK